MEISRCDKSSLRGADFQTLPRTLLSITILLIPEYLINWRGTGVLRHLLHGLHDLWRYLVQHAIPWKRWVLFWSGYLAFCCHFSFLGFLYFNSLCLYIIYSFTFSLGFGQGPVLAQRRSVLLRPKPIAALPSYGQSSWFRPGHIWHWWSMRDFRCDF